MQAILHCDRKWGIGKRNDLMFRLPKDMKFFRTTTSGKVVVMGSNTLLSFPGGMRDYGPHIPHPVVALSASYHTLRFSSNKGIIIWFIRLRCRILSCFQNVKMNDIS